MSKKYIIVFALAGYAPHVAAMNAAKSAVISALLLSAGGAQELEKKDSWIPQLITNNSSNNANCITYLSTALTQAESMLNPMLTDLKHFCLCDGSFLCLNCKNHSHIVTAQIENITRRNLLWLEAHNCTQEESCDLFSYLNATKSNATEAYSACALEGEVMLGVTLSLPIIVGISVVTIGIALIYDKICRMNNKKEKQALLAQTTKRMQDV